MARRPRARGQGRVSAASRLLQRADDGWIAVLGATAITRSAQQAPSLRAKHATGTSRKRNWNEQDIQLPVEPRDPLAGRCVVTPEPSGEQDLPVSLDSDGADVVVGTRSGLVESRVDAPDGV